MSIYLVSELYTLCWFQSTVFNHVSSSSNIAGKTFHVGDKHSIWTVLIAGLHMTYACVPRTVTYCLVLKHTFEKSFRCIPCVDPYLIRLVFISLCCGCLLMSCMLVIVRFLPSQLSTACKFELFISFHLFHVQKVLLS